MVRRHSRDQMVLVSADQQGPWLPEPAQGSARRAAPDAGVRFLSASDVRRRRAIDTESDIRGLKPQPWQLALTFSEPALPVSEPAPDLSVPARTFPEPALDLAAPALDAGAGRA